MPLGLTKARQDDSTILCQDLSRKNKEERGEKRSGRKVGREVSNLEGGDRITPLFSVGFPEVPFQALGSVSG